MTYLPNLKKLKNKTYQAAVSKGNGNENSGGFSGGCGPNTEMYMRADNVEYMDFSSINIAYKGYCGICDTGDYIFYIPQGDNYYFLRYDKSQAFTTSAVSVIDISNGGSTPQYKGFRGAVFDGRYVYFVPYTVGGVYYGNIIRYDTTAAFTYANLSFFDLTTINANYKGYYGACFDGRYVYFSPYSYGTASHGNFVRYDTTGSFTSAGSYTVHDLTTINANYKGFINITCSESGYIYMSSYYHMVGGIKGIILRYKFDESFTSSGSYESIDLEAINVNYKGYFGFVETNEYIFTIPWSNGSSSGIFARYDKAKNFTENNSWDFFDMGTIDSDYKGFLCAAVSGRYIYFVPYKAGVSEGGVVVRYDTKKDMDDTTAYASFDLATVDSDLVGFFASLFDGQHLYLSPYTSSGSTSGVAGRVKLSPYNRGI